MRIAIEGAKPGSVRAVTIESDDLYATDLQARELEVGMGDAIEAVLPHQSVSGIALTPA